MAIDIRTAAIPVEIPAEEQEAILADVIAILRGERRRWLKKRQSLLTSGAPPDTMELSTIVTRGGGS